MNKKAIIIGSGFGGIASAIRLRAMNYDVTLIEKNSDLGGRARTFYKNGYTFDAGPTVITAPYLIEELFSLFKKNINDYVKIVPLKIWYQFIFSDLSKFDYTDDHKVNLQQISKINSEDIIGFEKLLKFSEKIFNKGYLELADKPFTNFFFMLKQIPSLLLLKSYFSVYKLVSKFLKHEKLRKIFSVQPLLVGGNPFSTTSIYALILFLEKKWGVHYALGGTGKIIIALEKLMNEIGVKIIKNDEVIKIITDKKNISGVITKSNKIINAKIVVCNADPPFVYKYLLDEKQNTFLFKKKGSWVARTSARASSSITWQAAVPARLRRSPPGRSTPSAWCRRASINGTIWIRSFVGLNCISGRPPTRRSKIIQSIACSGGPARPRRPIC